jgi:hypothetical protein
MLYIDKLTIGNPIKEAEEVVEEEEGQERDEELKTETQTQTRTGRHTEVAVRLYQLMEHIKNPQYISRDFLLQMKRYKVECQL